MIDLRLWRIVLLAAPLALTVAMFSLDQVPQPLQPELPPDAFDAETAKSLARDLAAQAPEPRPGSDQDAALGESVLSHFRQIPGIEASEQRFTGEYKGDDVELRNLIAVLPGESDRQVALIAHRDVATGSGGASTIASTAALIQIAEGFSGSTHEKTLVFVSTDGGSIGALGARRFAEDYSDASLLDATIELSQPAAQSPSPPLVIPWSTGTRLTSAKLEETANTIVSGEADRPAGDESPISDVFRLAIPSALGEQGPLIESGLDSVRLSSSGELPPPASEDGVDQIDTDTYSRIGRAALSLMLAIDGARSPLEPTPTTYVGLAGNLLPGWTLSMLALALLLPIAVTGFAAIAQAASSPLAAARAAGWVALRAAPFVLSLAVIWFGALVGLIPSPEFPFLPSETGLGTAGSIAVGVAFVVFAAAAFLLRPLLAPPPAMAKTAPAAAVCVAALGGFGVWLVNPFLALLVALGMQMWVVAAARVAPGRLAAAGLVAAGLIPVAGAVIALAGRFDEGIGVAWDLLLMLTGGQLGWIEALLGCLLAGAALAVVASAGDPAPAGEGQISLGALAARGRVLEERRNRRAAKQREPKRRRGRGRRERPEPPPAPEDGQPEPELEPEPAEPEAASGDPGAEEPAPDPRMWSKPPGSSSRPSGARTYVPSPSTTRPISVSP